MCHRTGVQPLEPKGQGWDYGIGVSEPGMAAGPGLPGHMVPAPRWPGVGGRPGQSLRGAWAPAIWKDGLCPSTPCGPGDAALPFRGAGTTSPSGPTPPGLPGAHPRRRLASRASPAGPRGWPVPCRRPWAPSAAEATSLAWWAPSEDSALTHEPSPQSEPLCAKMWVLAWLAGTWPAVTAQAPEM